MEEDTFYWEVSLFRFLIIRFDVNIQFHELEIHQKIAGAME